MRYKIVFLLFFATIFLNAFAQPVKYLGEKKLYYGAAYYPEIWDESEIDRDIIRMKKLDMNVMRIGEFAWTKMEPTEGQFNFAWLHRVIEKLKANGIDVILGTPTATPPIWMAEKYPEIFRIDETGITKTHGARRSCSYTSRIYREFSIKICDKMAQEFGNKTGVIGWQTDNEFGMSPDYSKETEVIWHAWLKIRYGTIDRLNKLWYTDLWSQRYERFDQIPMPSSLIWHHTSLRFVWDQFCNDQVVDYQDLQLKAIRNHSKLPVTHDGMPGQTLDYEKLFKNLDYAAVNNYHSFEAYPLIQSNYDRMRGMGKGYHWLFETAANYSGGGEGGNAWYLHQIPGSMKAALWMNYASGAQGSMFWLWRQHPAGHEMPHGSILSAWGDTTANYSEIKELGHELNKSSDFLMNNPVKKAESAIVYSHVAQMGLRIEQYANGLSYYQDWSNRFYRPMADAHILRDVIYPSADISGYKLLFVPLMPYMPLEFQNRLKEWVENGGTLILGPMTGYRTEEWAQFTDHFTGGLEDWTGIYTVSVLPIGTTRRSAEIPFMLKFDSSLDIPMSESSLFSLALRSPEGKIVATTQGGAHNNHPAIIENKVGSGHVVILGTDPGKEAMQKLLLHYAGQAGIKPMASGGDQIVIIPREGQQKGWVLVNLTREAKKVTLNSETERFLNILTGKRINGKNFELAPFEVKVLKED